MNHRSEIILVENMIRIPCCFYQSGVPTTLNSFLIGIISTRYIRRARGFIATERKQAYRYRTKHQSHYHPLTSMLKLANTKNA